MKRLPTYGHGLVAAIPLAWLLPNHYPPWLSAWQEGLSLALLFAGAALLGRRVVMPRLWTMLGAAALGSIAAQAVLGQMTYAGDALMAALYILAFLLAIAVGAGSMAGGPDAAPDPQQTLSRMAAITACAASACVGIALLQWTQAGSLGIYAADLRQGAQPYGNLAQANHFASALFLGLCSVALLYELGRIGAVGMAALGLFLLLGLVMSGSRTGMLQVLAASIMVFAFRKRGSLRLPAACALAACCVLAVGGWLWPAINEATLLSGARSLEVMASESVRLPLWRALLDAVSRQPWAGYGWQQVVLAQLAVAPDHAALARHFEYSHNLVVDLLVWAGAPVGILLVAALALGLWRLLKGISDARSFWLVAGVVGLSLHAMLEYPHAYAYFLLPIGLSIGMASALQNATPTWICPAALVRGIAVALGIVLAAIGLEYAETEASHRLLRLESARIGTTGIESPAVELRLLTQMEAFQRFARTEARSGMDAQELQQMQDAAHRFAYPPSLLRLALAQGLNDLPVQAQRSLTQLCAMHPKPRCDEAREAWTSMRTSHPRLPDFPDQSLGRPK